MQGSHVTFTPTPAASGKVEEQEHTLITQNHSAASYQLVNKSALPENHQKRQQGANLDPIQGKHTSTPIPDTKAIPLLPRSILKCNITPLQSPDPDSESDGEMEGDFKGEFFMPDDPPVTHQLYCSLYKLAGVEYRKPSPDITLVSPTYNT